VAPDADDGVDSHGWWALGRARRPPAAARVPLRIDGAVVGSVERLALPALARAVGSVASVAPSGPGASWRIDAEGVSLDVAGPGQRSAGDAEDRCAVIDVAFAAVDAVLRSRGLIVGWRDERVAVFDRAGRVRARIERAAARFWGTLTLGAHATGWVAGPDARPASIWLARRSFAKTTDPGAWDNLIGGGVPAEQDPWQALQREGWEEAGLDAGRLATACAGRIVAIEGPVEGGWKREWVHAFDLELAPGERPCNQDGEVQSFACLPLDDALALAGGPSMTVDASLVTLDFALRHRLLGDRAPMLEAAASGLWITPARGGPADRHRVVARAQR
jgi:8-oxo-dGTP pyrophosphatase MutT (NUDIX family)